MYHEVGGSRVSVGALAEQLLLGASQHTGLDQWAAVDGWTAMLEACNNGCVRAAGIHVLAASFRTFCFHA